MIGLPKQGAIMPRNTAGVYSLPSGYKAVTGDNIVVSQHNPPLEDIAQALTESLCSDGRTPMTGLLTLSGAATGDFHPVTFKQFKDERAAAAITGGTIAGVSINGAAIGGTTPAAGTFTYLAVTGGASKSAVLSPAQITSNQNDYAPTQATAPTALDAAAIIRLTSDAARTITGLVAPTTNAAGREISIVNIGSFALTLAAESASSTAANRFAVGGDIIIQPGGSVVLWYDATSSRWRPRADAGQFNASLLGAGKIPVDRLPSGSVIGSASATYTTAASLTSAIPGDSTKPQIGEGTEILSISYTPKIVGSKIRCRFSGFGAGSSAGIICTAAMFVNGATDAVRTVVQYSGGGGGAPQVLAMEYEFTVAALTAQTIAVRAGPNASTFYINQMVGSTWGGTPGCVLVVEEIAP